VRMADGSAWLTQRLMADLFQVGVNTINHHIKGVCADRELAPEATIRKYRIVQSEGGAGGRADGGTLSPGDDPGGRVPRGADRWSDGVMSLSRRTT
jgi:hypothetical protein